MTVFHEPVVSIRPATAGDYAAIVAVWRAAGLAFRAGGRDGEAGFRRQLARFPGLYLVATDADRIVGVVLGTHDERKGWINRLAVLPAYRRRGVGAALVAACDAAIRRAGIEIVAALVEPENASSAALFAHAGYSEDVPVRYFRKCTRPDA
ncbi:MAG: GNAT family N-acetyltransferase [Phycisphaerae bacterium]